MTATIQQLRRLVKKHTMTMRLVDWLIQADAAALDHVADCESNPEYKTAKLRFCVEKIPAQEAESFVIHELAHCHVEGLARVATSLACRDERLLEWIRSEEERLTTMIKHIVCGILESHGSDDATTQARKRPRSSKAVRRSGAKKGGKARR